MHKNAVFDFTANTSKVNVWYFTLYTPKVNLTFIFMPIAGKNVFLTVSTVDRTKPYCEIQRKQVVFLSVCEQDMAFILQFLAFYRKYDTSITFSQ